MYHYDLWRATDNTMKLKEALAAKLSKKELAYVPSSFDIIGDIAIFNDMPKKLRKREKMIAQTLMSLHSNVRAVAKKVGKFSGKLRTPKITVIAGEKRKETLHKENGCFLKLHIEKCYFSPRLASERLRIAKLVKKGEDVLVLFSGVAPYPCVIAKNALPKEVCGIELNKAAHKYAEENIKLNKLSNIALYQGDVKKILPKIKKRFSRIIMPLPKDSPTYLDLALKKLKPKGTIHLYLFAHENELETIKRSYKKSFKKVNVTSCGLYAPYVHRICLDIRK